MRSQGLKFDADALYAALQADALADKLGRYGFGSREWRAASESVVAALPFPFAEPPLPDIAGAETVERAAVRLFGWEDVAKARELAERKRAAQAAALALVGGLEERRRSLVERVQAPFFEAMETGGSIRETPRELIRELAEIREELDALAGVKRHIEWAAVLDEEHALAALDPPRGALLILYAAAVHARTRDAAELLRRRLSTMEPSERVSVQARYGSLLGFERAYLMAQERADDPTLDRSKRWPLRIGQVADDAIAANEQDPRRLLLPGLGDLGAAVEELAAV